MHASECLLVHMANLILIRRDSYLEHVKVGVKQDTMNILRNSPLFGYGVFPDAATAEQDITKHESTGVAPGPGPGAPQQSKWRGSHRYRPCESREPISAGSTEQSSQEQQPLRQFSRNRSRGRGRARGSNPPFSKARQFKPYK